MVMSEKVRGLDYRFQLERSSRKSGPLLNRTQVGK